MRGRGCLIAISLGLVAFWGISNFYNGAYLSYDITEMVYHALALKQGRIPYVEDITHHFLGYAFPLMLFNTPNALWFLNGLYLTVTGILAYLMAQEIGLKSSSFLVAISAVTIGWLYGWVGFIFETQNQVLPFLWLYFCLLLRFSVSASLKSLFLAGVTLGGMFILDQRAVLFGVVFLALLGMADKDRRISSLVRFALGSLSIPALCAIWLAAHGALWSCFEHTILFPIRYRNFGVPFSVVEFFWRGIRAEPLTVTVIAIAGLLMFCPSKPAPRIRAAYWSLLLAGLGYAVVGGRYYLNYFILLHPVMVLSIAVILQSVPLRSTKWALSILCAMQAFTPIKYSLAAGSWRVPIDEYVMVESAKRVSEYSNHSDDVMVWGPAPRIYLLAERMTSFPDMGLYSALGANYGSESLEAQRFDSNMFQRLKQYMLTTPPKVFVFYETFKGQNPRYPGPPDTKAVRRPYGPVMKQMDFRKHAHLNYVRDLLAERYEMLDHFEGMSDRAEVYRLRSAVD